MHTVLLHGSQWPGPRGHGGPLPPVTLTLSPVGSWALWGQSDFFSFLRPREAPECRRELGWGGGRARCPHGPTVESWGLLGSTHPYATARVLDPTIVDTHHNTRHTRVKSCVRWVFGKKLRQERQCGGRCSSARPRVHVCRAWTEDGAR